MKNNNKVSNLALGVLLIASLALNVWLFSKKENAKNQNLQDLSASVIKQVSAKEIYPMFLCPCCGQPLDPENICCSMAKERIGFIDSLVAKNISEKEIVLSYIQKYGFNSFVDIKKREEFKEELIKTAPEVRPQIIVTPDTLDLGDISQAKGEMNTLFEVINAGKSDLIISKLDTSCGCTSASIVYKGEEGPRFAMAGHGIENSTGWQIIIPSGEKAQLKVYYDPSIHKDFRGAAIREISVYSNDPIDFEKKVRIELNQVD